MSFVESPRFPDAIGRNASRKVRTRTEIVSGQSGIEQRNALWLHKRRAYEVSLPPRLSENWSSWIAFMESLRGPADGFRFRDPADYSSTHATGALWPYVAGVLSGTAGYGYGVPTYQLAKIYTAWATATPRRILKPIAAALEIKRAGIIASAGAGAGQYALSTVTGVVTWAADQQRAISSHAVGATHQFTLASAFAPNFAVGGRLFATGITGTAATLLNSLPLQITAVAADIVTVAVNTTGLTASGGTAFFYPQPAETLTWAGNFDMPVRFESDELADVMMQRTMAGDLMIQTPTIELIELLNP